MYFTRKIHLICAALGLGLLSAVVGCGSQDAPPGVFAAGDEPSAEDILDTADQTSVYIGSSRYYIAEPTKSARADESKSKPVPSAKNKNTPTAKSEKQKSPAKSAPMNVDLVLEKSKDISIGVATDAPSGRIQNDDVSFVPASITKVFTSAAALRSLGPDFRFKTRVGVDVNSKGRATKLLIFSDGDPTMGMGKIDGKPATRMLDIVSALKLRGVKELNGSITFVSADPRVDDAVYAQGILETDASECYGAMASTFNFNSNCSEVVIHAKNGFRWKDVGAGDFLTNSLETFAGDRTDLSLAAMFTPDRILEGFVLRGSYLAKSPKSIQRQLPVANAVGWYAAELVKTLRANQISVKQATLRVAKTPAERSVVFNELSQMESDIVSIESPPLSDMMSAMNKQSDNFLADSLFKALASNHLDSSNMRSDPWKESLAKSSQRKLRQELDRWLSADGHSGWSNEFAFYDGAGLSTENRATPRAFLAVLRQLAKEPTFSTLWDSLPIAGVDGTLGERMKKSPAAGKVRGKTGTLSGSYQLVGFIPKIRGSSVEYVPFVILTATTKRNRTTVRKLQDILVAKMYETVNADK